MLLARLPKDIVKAMSNKDGLIRPEFSFGVTTQCQGKVAMAERDHK